MENRGEPRYPVLIIGAGRGGTALLEIFLEEAMVNVVAVADINPEAAGLRLARQHGIATFTDAVSALEYCRRFPDCVVYNLSHDDTVADAAQRIFGDKRVAGGAEVKLFWQMIMNLKQARLDLEKSQHQLQSIIHNVMDGIITLDEAGRIQGFNPAAEKIFGYTQQAVQGRDIGLLAVELAQDAAQPGTPRRALLERLGQRGVEMQGRRHDGTAFPMDLSLSEMHLGGVRYFIGIVRDITERKQAEAKIAHLAHHDFLTGLPNRAHFSEILTHAIALSGRNHGKLAVMFIDLDGFKKINDTLGHEAGDLLLRGVAQRLQESVRQSDVVARIGGDEFILLLENIGDAENAAAVAQKIIAHLATPFDLNGTPGRVGASIGIALYPQHGESAEALLRRADEAMYQSKQSGKNTYRFAGTSANSP